MIIIARARSVDSLQLFPATTKIQLILQLQRTTSYLSSHYEWSWGWLGAYVWDDDDLLGSVEFIKETFLCFSCSWHCLMSIIALECADHRQVIATKLSHYADFPVLIELDSITSRESRTFEHKFQLIERFFSRFFLTSLLNFFAFFVFLYSFFFRTNFFPLLLFSSSCVFLLSYSTRCERDGEWVRECWCLSLSPKKKTEYIKFIYWCSMKTTLCTSIGVQLLLEFLQMLPKHQAKRELE